MTSGAAANGTELAALVPRFFVANDLDCPHYTPEIRAGAVFPNVIFIIMMQVGFATLETGTVSMLGVTNVLIKNLVDLSVGTAAFWAFGFAFSFGDDHLDNGSPFIGRTGIFFADLDSCQLLLALYQLSFALSSVTIVSGALGNRITVFAYVVFTFFFVGFIYPICSHWVYSVHGWLHTGTPNDLAYIDFASAGAVHCVGGIAALVGSTLVEPRRERLASTTFSAPPPHSVPLVAMGGMLIFVGFLAFNSAQVAFLGPTVLTADSYSALTALVVLNSMLCSAFSLLTYTVYVWLLKKPFTLTKTLNAFLSGLVAACAVGPYVAPWTSVIFGIASCFMMIFLEYLELKYRVDDVVSAFPVHTGGALAGLLLGPFFFYESGIVYSGSVRSFEQFGWNLLGAVVLIFWAAATSIVVFLLCKVFQVLRVPDFYLKTNVDAHVHEELGYVFSSQVITRALHTHDAFRQRQAEQQSPPGVTPVSLTSPPLARATTASSTQVGTRPNLRNRRPMTSTHSLADQVVRGVLQKRQSVEGSLLQGTREQEAEGDIVSGYHNGGLSRATADAGLASIANGSEVAAIAETRLTREVGKEQPQQQQQQQQQQQKKKTPEVVTLDFRPGESHTDLAVVETVPSFLVDRAHPVIHQDNVDQDGTDAPLPTAMTSTATEKRTHHHHPTLTISTTVNTSPLQQQQQQQQQHQQQRSPRSPATFIPSRVTV